MRNKLILFSKKLKSLDIEFLKKDFREIDIEKLDKNTFIYCDPPYLITNATYNENNKWTKSDEEDLLKFLDLANEKGFKFALSNVLESKNNKNDMLNKWINKNNYYCNYIDKKYSNSNYQRKDKESITIEVLITNYKV